MILAPQIASVNLINDNAIEVTFTENITSETATVLSNYQLSNDIGINAVLDDGNGQVTLLLNSELQAGTLYTLTVNGLQDCVGNTSENVTTQIGIPEPAEPFDLLINEIFADPDPPAQYDLPSLTLPREKFIELFNRSNKIISLEGWQLRDATDTATLSSYLLLPNDYLLLCSTTNAAAFTAQGFPTLGVTNFPEPNTTEDVLTLVSETGTVIHTVAYDNTWYRDNIKSQGGWTLELIDPNNPCGGSDNWRASVDSRGGTPAAQNSVLAANPDTQPLDVLRAEAFSPTQIAVYFGENIQAANALTTDNYTIDNGIGAPVSVALYNQTLNAVLLTLSNPLQANTVYTLTVANNVTDCAGNAVGMNNEVRVGLAVAPEVGDLVINEILFNPSTGGYDYVELYNRSNKIISLNGLYFATADVSENPDSLIDFIPVAPIRYSVFPNEFVVITENPTFVI